MIDFKNTLINLHKKFPDYDLDTLIAIIDSIVETVNYNRIDYIYPNQGIRCPDLSKVMCENESPSTWNDILNKDANTTHLEKNIFDDIKYSSKISTIGRKNFSDKA